MPFIDTPTLRVAYDIWNPAGAKTAILLHGWPDSAQCWAAVAPRLAAAGWRVLAPELRGFGATRFRDAATPRSGQLAALGRDLLEFIAALQIERPLLVGHDWGARAVANACGLEPGVARALVMISVGYGTNTPRQMLCLPQAQRFWYHWYMATPRGADTVRDDRRAFTRHMWDTWSAPGWYAPAAFEAAAAAFDNPDWAEITVSSYRHRWGHADGDPAYAADEARLEPPPVLEVPTLVLHGAADLCNHPDASAGKDAFFRGPYERRLLAGVGHFPPREAPQAVAEAILAFVAAGANGA